jgi:Tol biopolymer transport system component
MKAQSTLGIFAQSSDIGNVKFKGSGIYDPVSARYILKGSGLNMWFGNDEFHFLWKKINGDFILYSWLEWIGKGVALHRKAGLIIRESLDAGSPYISAAFHGDGLMSMQFRLEKDSETKEIQASSKFLPVLQLERKGDSIIMYASEKNSPLKKIGEISMKFKQDEVYTGLFICSHDTNVTEEVIFMNTRLTFPAKADFVPYQDYIGSRLEILDVETGQRKIIYESDMPFEAPNWSLDGKYIVVNRQGLLYRISVEGGKPELINTGFADNNNNDHGFSPDGKQIAISHSPNDRAEGNSVIYTIPASGGKPKRITDKSPSYWHGWSPDGIYLIYTANRNNQWGIYRIPAKGGDEVQLTNSPFLDDGSEYSTDGKSIWFNSNRSGIMEIWQMRNDGSELKQITSDEYQNWFAHQSPDGKNIVFISYPPEVNLWDHPYYKHVMLRMMKADGGEPWVVAHLYGGQGTINVPSWSPDSKKLAFVSNSDKIK